MPHRSYASTANYRFGFNGKENDNEPKGLGNQQDYGMRIYDPRLGKFLSVDPITEDYPFYSSYQFASNSPILSIDIDGLEANNKVNQSENFFLGFLDGFTGDAPNTPVGMSSGTTDIHAGKVTRDLPVIKNNIKRFQDNPGKKIADDFENSLSETGKTIDKLKSGDSYSWGSLLGGVVRIGLEIFSLHLATSEPTVTTGPKVSKSGSPAGQQQKASNAELNNAKNSAPPPSNNESPSNVNSKPAQDWNGPIDYSDLPEPRKVGPYLPTTRAQRTRILNKNKELNKGVIRSDEDGSILDQPQNTKKGQKANMKQGEVDHIDERDNGGSNSNKNLRVVSKQQNHDKEMKRRKGG